MMLRSLSCFLHKLWMCQALSLLGWSLSARDWIIRVYEWGCWEMMCLFIYLLPVCGVDFPGGSLDVAIVNRLGIYLGIYWCWGIYHWYCYIYWPFFRCSRCCLVIDLFRFGSMFKVCKRRHVRYINWLFPRDIYLFTTNQRHKIKRTWTQIYKNTWPLNDAFWNIFWFNHRECICSISLIVVRFRKHIQVYK